MKIYTVVTEIKTSERQEQLSTNGEKNPAPFAKHIFGRRDGQRDSLMCMSFKIQLNCVGK